MARTAAYLESPEVRARDRISELSRRVIGGCRSAAEEEELDDLRRRYPDLPLDPDDPLYESIKAWGAANKGKF